MVCHRTSGREGAWIFRPALCADPRLDPRPCTKVTRYRGCRNTWYLDSNNLFVSLDLKVTSIFLDRLPYFSILGRIKDVWTISTVSDTQDHWTIYNQANNRSYVGTRVRNGDRLHRCNVGIVKLSKAVHFLSFADRATLHCNILAVRCI